MTLGQAIAHARKKISKTRCGQEHKQLAEWLERLQRYEKALLDINKVCDDIGIFPQALIKPWPASDPIDPKYWTEQETEYVRTPLAEGYNEAVMKLSEKIWGIIYDAVPEEIVNMDEDRRRRD